MLSENDHTGIVKPGSRRFLIIGVGNEIRSDDAVGLWVSRALKGKNLPHAMVREARGEGVALMEMWKEADTLILIDAVSSGARPGTIYRLEAHAEPIPATFFRHSTHAFGLAEAIELARALDQLPPRVILYGIEGRIFETGVRLSPEVEKAAQQVVTRIAEEVCIRSPNP
jgi:hydrogenase maturation protease